MIQIRNTTERKLDEICQRHYNKINRVVKLAILRNTVEPKTQFLLDVLEKIIKGHPHELIEVNQLYLDFCQEHEIDPNGVDIRQSFSYGNFRNRSSYNAYHLAEELNVKVCPYCNRQYTFTVRTDDVLITRPQFDHFFSNVEFPLLALSFYNLIPSCYICNSALKHDRLFRLDTHFHPYLGSFGNGFKFVFQGLTPASFEGLDKNYEVDVVFDATNRHRQKIEANAGVFELKNIYGHHKDQIREVVRKYHVSGGSYIERLSAMFDLDSDDREELYLLAFGNYYHADKHELRPLARFVSDIYDDVFLGEVEKPEI